MTNNWHIFFFHLFYFILAKKSVIACKLWLESPTNVKLRIYKRQCHLKRAGEKKSLTPILCLIFIIVL